MATLFQSIRGWFTRKEVGPKITDDEQSPGILGGEIAGLDWNLDQDDAELREAYKGMLADPAVKAALFTKLFEVCALELNVQPADQTPEAQKIADFIKYCLSHIHGGVASGLLMKTAKPALQYQFSISEILLKYQDTGEWKGKYTIDRLKSKDVSGEDWKFDLDKFKNVLGYTCLTDEGLIRYPKTKFVHFAFMLDFENPRGISDLRAAYRSWFVKKYVMRAWAVLSEKVGPVPIGSYENEAHREALEKQLKAFSSRRWLAVPADVKITIEDFASNQTKDNYEALVRALDKQILLGIRGAFLQSLEGDRTGARSMGEVHESQADLWVWYLSYTLAATINDQIVKSLVVLNFGEGIEPPQVKLEAAVQEDLETASRIDMNLSKLGLPLSKTEIYERYGRQPPKDEEDTLEAPAPASPFGGGKVDENGEPMDDMDEMDEDKKPEGEEKKLAGVNRGHEESWLGEFMAEYSRLRRH